ncbi:Vacuolar protein sorting-associated protein 13C [Operophtera brumata]|uniref:Vacuolar protein sorting-associated protein 13C n=1 Tax=Operophtera brumata TaxID=104452 RepID=A0A0L7K2B7_OPEBR|nr:Vacuolar protein sorting-associated protein 13C [Operophtera brumata]
MSSQFGARHCFFLSTIRRLRQRIRRRPVESYLLTEDYIAANPSIIEYARSLFEVCQITAEDRICRPCLQRANRFVILHRRTQEQEESAQQVELAPSSGSSSVGLLSPDPLREAVLDIPEEVPQDNEEVPQEQAMPQLLNVPLIPVPGFKRIAFSSTCCIVADCDHRQTLHRIHLMIRVKILSQHGIYIPRGTRVCGEHLRVEPVWGNMVTHCRPTHDTFNSAQIADMMKMLQKMNLQYLNFEKINTFIFPCYVGHRKDIFINILEASPSMFETFKKPKTALATVMCKLHTGDSNQRLASVFRMTPQYFCRIMKRARKCLMSDFVPKHLGPDGYITEAFGPHAATKPDASIMADKRD